MPALVFKPSSCLTFDTVQKDSQRLLALLKVEKGQSLCLDLHEVAQCDSAGLAFLIEAKRVCQQYKKTFLIEGLPDVISALAVFCGVDTLLLEKAC